MLKRVENKVSLNIKISKNLDDRLKRARKYARSQGLKFNVSHEVEKFLIKELEKVEFQLHCDEESLRVAEKMSQAVSYEDFCTRYQLNPEKTTSKDDYNSYLDKLNVLNESFSEKITTEALKKAKK